nr:MAG TPA: DNA N-6-adenine-methyltransferase [Caudoviricetes sp.]
MKSKTYEEFVEKFKPKKTTDDCYTPPTIYEVVKQWACDEYGIDPDKIVRPFYPGGDYEAFPYPDGAVVVDNPPFSILAGICTFYLEHGIPFFLFAPSLTCFSGRKIFKRMNHIIADCQITYENGARVKTSFVTSYSGGIVAQTAPDLTKEINRENDRLIKANVKELPKYDYPMNVITAAMMQRYAKYGVDLKIRAEDCIQVGGLDAQKRAGKSIFGSGLLLCERAAAERAAAERAAAERAAAERAAATKWELSDREKAIIQRLGQKLAVCCTTYYYTTPGKGVVNG